MMKQESLTASVYFFVGTEAELIKVFPVMLALEKLEIAYRIIASGQNNIEQSAIFAEMGKQKVDLQLSREEEIQKSAAGLLRWFFKTQKTAVDTIRSAFAEEDFSRAWLIVHGDTISTVMGAMVGKKLGMTIAHVEAGMRSHNIFSPFPEEIDRMLASHMANWHFAPGAAACENLKNKHHVVDTKYNTIYDALHFSYTIPAKSPVINSLQGIRYFVFVLHRQENLMNVRLVKDVVEQVRSIAKETRCIFILHKPTEIALTENGLLGSLAADKNIQLVPRMEYFDFMKLLAGSVFVITDGGSNQQELHYMGKPCLIMRKTSETKEGLGMNAELYGGDVSKIKAFARIGEQRQILPTYIDGDTPSQIVAATIKERIDAEL